MMNKTLPSILALLVFSLSFTGCEKYFGDKTDLSFIEVPDYDADRQIAYVPIQPSLNDFAKPVDVCIGFDELIYVVDEVREEVVCLDEAGRVLGRKSIPGAKSVAQDRKFDLLVIGRLDTQLIRGNDTVDRSFSTIYRLDQFGGGGYNLNNAVISNKIVHPFYFKSNADSTDQINIVSFQRISIIADNGAPDINNQFYVTREGDKPLTPTFAPDDAVCYFNNDDSFITTIIVNSSSGVFRDYFLEPSGITTLAQPPQLTTTPGRDFIYTSLDPNNQLKVQYLQYVETEFTSFYQVRLLATGDTTQADGFINSPNKFRKPYDITVAGDASRYIFVVDSETDSLHQFNFTGFEGVQPPAATGIRKFQKASFGGTGNALTEFNNPTAVAYFNEILYVADSENGRVLRFKLTLDFE